MILGIDPGPVQSGWAVLRDGSVVESGVTDNEILMHWMQEDGWYDATPIAIEMIASYGMPVGAEVFETCVWIGRFMQLAGPERVRRIYRKDVKLHLCGTARAKDGNVRQALIDKLGPQGTKKAKGPTYGVRSHAWAALAVAVTCAETMDGTRR